MCAKARSTTIVAVKRGGRVAMAGDGQVTMGETVIKQRAAKIRRLYKDTIMAGFAGAAADAITLFDRFESKLQDHQGNLLRAAVELAKDWRMDKYLRRLEALMIVANSEKMLILSGTGEIIEPDDDVCAIGSGGPYALASAKALLRNTDLSAREIAEQSIRIAAEICVYTNDSITIDEL
ncbi:MAG TPA: ATP-dependent protease subunit HslV [Proteobacteria bacterium]|nr:ATP-dependent protease subunit HslV [Pseudomonadota bacterium]